MSHGFLDPFLHVVEQDLALLGRGLQLVVEGSGAPSAFLGGSGLLAELDVVDVVCAAHLAEVEDDAVHVVVVCDGEFIFAAYPVGAYVERIVAALAAVGGAVLILELQLAAPVSDLASNWMI